MSACILSETLHFEGLSSLYRLGGGGLTSTQGVTLSVRNRETNLVIANVMPVFVLALSSALSFSTLDPTAPAPLFSPLTICSIIYQGWGENPESHTN